MKGFIRVEFVDEYGNPEAGIDGGGLFKEFLTTLCTAAFHPGYGLFVETDDNYLYPSLTSEAMSGDSLDYYCFVGMIMGKAIYEGIVIDPQFANFFLRKLLGQPILVDDLSTMDQQLYRSICLLRNYTGSFEDLCLTFSTGIDEFGAYTVYDLIPDGRNIPVTKDNRVLFLHKLADFRLNVRLQKQTSAFLSGLHTVLDVKWLKMFSAHELQVLISGTKAINIEDWRQNSVYAGYDEQSEQIRWFWEVTQEMSDEDLSDLLKFSTSCSRAPLLGFGSLNPRFCVQRSGNNPDSLPTSSTCVNQLKLPFYRSKEKLKDRLIYAIKSKAGFDLS